LYSAMVVENQRRWLWDVISGGMSH